MFANGVYTDFETLQKSDYSPYDTLFECANRLKPFATPYGERKCPS